MWLSRCPDGGSSQLARATAVCAAADSDLLYSSVAVNAAPRPQSCDPFSTDPVEFHSRVALGALFSTPGGTSALACQILDGGKRLARAVSRGAFRVHEFLSSAQSTLCRPCL